MGIELKMEIEIKNVKVFLWLPQIFCYTNAEKIAPLKIPKIDKIPGLPRFVKHLNVLSLILRSLFNRENYFQY